MEEPVLKKVLLAALAALLAACSTLEPAPAPEPPAAAAPEPAPAPEPVAAPRFEPKPVPAPPPLPLPLVAEKPAPEPEPPAVTLVEPAPVGDLWERIRKGFAMKDLEGKLVKQKTAQYAARPEYLQRIIERSKLYLYHIVEEIEKRGLPTELALLPMVESAFNPMAYSRAHASGLWQFIPGTGKRFDLEQNVWYDGRRDIVDSTNAALDYLTKLYEMHGDWHLALASYNWGENAVKRAIARNKRLKRKTDYASLRMPRETRHYIPKLQALKNIISDPAKYGVDLDAIPNQPYFAVITDAPDMDVHQAARLAEMPVEEFVALNPGFSRPLIRSAAAKRIILPADKVVVFYDNLDQHDEDSLVSWQVYTPQKGEKLEAIARKFDIEVKELRRINGIHPGSTRMPKELVVPRTEEALATIDNLPIMYAPPIPVPRAVHVVKRGDTLGGIAARYRTTVSNLKRWNRHVGRYLQIGQRIYIR